MKNEDKLKQAATKYRMASAERRRHVVAMRDATASMYEARNDADKHGYGLAELFDEVTKQDATIHQRKSR